MREGGQSSGQLGELIRGLRLTHGWSQSRLASEVCRVSGQCTVTRSEVSRWETGRRIPTPVWLRHLAAALQTPLATFDEAVRTMDRRTLITDLAATAIAPLAAADLIRSGFAAALRSGRPSIEAWQERLEQYGRDYMTQGAGTIRQRLAGDLVLLQQQLEHPQLWAVASKLMTLYGKTFPGSDGAKAAGWYQLAANAADRSGDDDTREWVRGRAAIALGYEGASLPVAAMFANQAVAIGDGRPTLARVNALMGRAHAAAILGDRRTALRLVDDGRRTFDHAGSDEQASDYSVPWWRFNVFTSLLGARIGDEQLVDEAQTAARSALPASLPRFRTHLDMHQGMLLARLGNRDAGATYAQSALDELPPEKHSLTLRMLMDEIKAG
ncbi:helix-turn-helix domain-containing protein [Actinocatenispora comari]|uniref:HTH cro/C1-type domain-containing protein n=1 Tax=Actinocatenispora comari TaxID=2807577 RepID=A0A8J4AGJ1_9ACTN|nr:helix-turn-helix transcriptional regulator [Actinocatenispora comari]GIL29150.1 hypothetical protein NUM_44040 [Actinocatenispora comari]